MGNGDAPRPARQGDTRVSRGRKRDVAAPLVVAFMVGLTLAVALHVRHVQGVYWSRTEVQFLEPRTFNPGGYSVDPGSGVIATASVVADKINEVDLPRLTSPDSTLAASGFKHGSLVALPNEGGQWANVFTDPWLDVQAVGTSPQEVLAEMTTQIQLIRTTLGQIQTRAGVAPQNLITTQVTPRGEPPLYYMSGSPSRATVMTLLLGAAAIGLTLRGLRGSWEGAAMRLRRRRVHPEAVIT